MSRQAVHFDAQGHCIITPSEAQLLIAEDRNFFIDGILLSATPAVFKDRSSHFNFLAWIADQFKVHPRNIVIRGSTVLNFSLKPKVGSLWVECRPDSDIDLAVIDSDYYHVFDREVRHLERRNIVDLKSFGETSKKRRSRQQHRKFYCYRYFDLPNVPAVAEQNAILKRMPIELFDRKRTIEAFVYRDWGSLYDRYYSELQTLHDGVEFDRLPLGETIAKPANTAIPIEDPPGS